VAGLLSCGVMAGLEATTDTGRVRRGDSVAAIGCGGVAGTLRVNAIIRDGALTWAGSA
jgi:S-(hydroxymethyl)mycothiol dehydrogenase